MQTPGQALPHGVFKCASTSRRSRGGRAGWSSPPGQALHKGYVAAGKEDDGQRVQAQRVVGRPAQQQHAIVIWGCNHRPPWDGGIQNHVQGQLVCDAQGSVAPRLRHGTSCTAQDVWAREEKGKWRQAARCVEAAGRAAQGTGDASSGGMWESRH